MIINTIYSIENTWLVDNKTYIIKRIIYIGEILCRVKITYIVNQ